MADETSTTESQPTEPQGRVFTQDEVGAIANKARKEETQKLLTDLGFESPDQIKEVLSDYRKHQDAEKSAEQRLAELEQEKQSLAGRATRYEDTVKGILESELQGIPEERRSLIPEELDDAAKLSYVSKNRAFLLDTKTETVTVGTPSAPGITPPAPSISFEEFKKLSVRDRVEFHDKYPEVAAQYTERLRTGD